MEVGNDRSFSRMNRWISSYAAVGSSSPRQSRRLLEDALKHADSVTKANTNRMDVQHGPPSWRLAQDGTAAIHTRTVQAPQRQELFHLFGNGTAASHQTHGASHMTMHVSMVPHNVPGAKAGADGRVQLQTFHQAATGRNRSSWGWRVLQTRNGNFHAIERVFVGHEAVMVQVPAMQNAQPQAGKLQRHGISILMGRNGHIVGVVPVVFIQLLSLASRAISEHLEFCAGSHVVLEEVLTVTRLPEILQTTFATMPHVSCAATPAHTRSATHRHRFVMKHVGEGHQESVTAQVDGPRPYDARSPTIHLLQGGALSVEPSDDYMPHRRTSVPTCRIVGRQRAQEASTAFGACLESLQSVPHSVPSCRGHSSSPVRPAHPTTPTHRGVHTRLRGR